MLIIEAVNTKRSHIILMHMNDRYPKESLNNSLESDLWELIELAMKAGVNLVTNGR